MRLKVRPNEISEYVTLRIRDLNISLIIIDDIENIVERLLKS